MDATHGKAQLGWVKFGDTSVLHSIGKDTIIFGYGNLLNFLDTTDRKETFYHANNQLRGDGVQCFCAHKSLPCFALAEKCRQPRILVNSYPSFVTIKTLEAAVDTFYISIQFSEMEFLIGLAGLPDHSIIIWNWRTTEKLLRQPIDAGVPGQDVWISLTTPVKISLGSSTSTTIQLWRMSLCYKKTLLDKQEVNLDLPAEPETRLPRAFCWGADGDFYCADARGNLFMLNGDTHEWIREIKAKDHTLTPSDQFVPSITWFKGGVVFATAEVIQFWRRRSPEGWTKVFTFKPIARVKTLVPVKESLYYWTERHQLVLAKGEKQVESVVIKNYGSCFDFLCFVNPLSDHFVTYGLTANMFAVYKKLNGDLVSTLAWARTADIVCMASSPTAPYLAVCSADGQLHLVNLYDASYPMELHFANLTHHKLDCVRFCRAGWQFFVATMDIGQVFLVKLSSKSRIEVVCHHKIDVKMADVSVMEEGDVLKLLVVPVSQSCCRSGQTLLTYIYNKQLNQLQPLEQLKLPSLCVEITPDISNRYFLCVPHRSRKLVKMSIDGQEVEHLISGHQYKDFKIKTTDRHVVSFGRDGIVTVRSADLQLVTAVFASHHRGNGGVKELAVDKFEEFIITLGEDGTLVCTILQEENISKKSLYHEYETILKTQLYKTTFLSSILASKTKAKALGQVMSLESKRIEEDEDKVSQTWLEMEQKRIVAEEEESSKAKKSQLLEKLTSLQDQVSSLLDANYANYPDQKLPIHVFDLNLAARKTKLAEATREREKVKQMDLALVKARDKVSDHIKTLCWTVMDKQSKGVFAIADPRCVFSYSLLPEKETVKETLQWTEERMKLEKFYRTGDMFEPWLPMTVSAMELVLATTFKVTQVDVTAKVKTELGEEWVSLGGEEEEEDTRHVWSGTATYRYINVNQNHYSQFELQTFYQCHNETVLIESDIHKLMVWFNKQFETMFSTKKKDMLSVMERNQRLRHIIEELQFFNFTPDICRTVIVDPKWEAVEQPENIVVVQDSEVMIPLYVSPSQQEILNRKEVEAEKYRHDLLTDNFRERALMGMMDGVLEKLWEDEIKKEIPMPKFMTEKDEEQWTEEDIRAHQSYQEAVKFLLTERERYRKLLEAEFSKHSSAQKENIAKLDEKMEEFHVLKLKVESAVCQEQLKILRMRHRNFQRIQLDRKEGNLIASIFKREKDIEGDQAELNTLQDILNDCRNAYENLQVRDKNLDKNLKKDFPEYSPVICEQLYKLFKKRPKLHQRASMFTTVLLDMGKCAVNNTKHDYLPAECLEYLNGIDSLDSTANAPAVVSEQSWDQCCKMRRLKIESELKIRAWANDLAEAESTVASYQKNLRTLRDSQVQLQQQLQVVRDEMVLQQQNHQVQLVLRQGLVEVPITGHMSDFENVILVGRDALNHVNGHIKKVGAQKIKAMERAANFRKGIITKEWEHKKLRMEIEDLKTRLEAIENIKVTKELQAILTARARGFTDDKGFMYLEKETIATKERFEKTQADLMFSIQDLDKRIEKITAENEQLDEKITEMNVEVNEKQLLRDFGLEKRTQNKVKHRMHLVVHRSKLVQKIQQQHNEILLLQTELELVRLKTYPTIKFKTL